MDNIEICIREYFESSSILYLLVISPYVPEIRKLIGINQFFNQNFGEKKIGFNDKTASNQIFVSGSKSKECDKPFREIVFCNAWSFRIKRSCEFTSINLTETSRI
ncbi:hypothetical protein BpHYR1_031001 [Brachionus plicatilis]|uniref:Uncharacterized protein n=1 Tax=Brachionus plicatilis TaxID=10195 RepID=A0A3M7SUK0_BRAPC|nr:hypothetical protein BpHYR1_031001 [Brachionus plicatilis]